MTINWNVFANYDFYSFNNVISPQGNRLIKNDKRYTIALFQLIQNISVKESSVTKDTLISIFFPCKSLGFLMKKDFKIRFNRISGVDEN